MGVVDEKNSRIPTVISGNETYLWRNRPLGAGGAGLTVKHTKGDSSVTIGFLDDEVEIPTKQARWLAEVLLQVTDRYRERFTDMILDDYTRPSDPNERR